MIPPLLLRIRKPELKIADQSCSNLIELEGRDVAARTGVIPESELRGISSESLGEMTDAGCLDEEWERGGGEYWLLGKAGLPE